MLSHMRVLVVVVAALTACSPDTDEPSPVLPGMDASDDGMHDVDGSVPVDVDVDADPPPGPVEGRVVVPVFDNAHIVSVQDEPGGFFQRAVSTIDWGTDPVRRATLRVELRSPCYPFENWTRPPLGHRWPSECDAFDRNFEFVMLPAEGSGLPGVELVRAITPFGGPMTFEVDITPVVLAHPGERTIEVHIATWPDGEGQVSGSRGGWYVDAEVVLVPGAPARPLLAFVPLINHSLGFGAEVPPIPFEVPEGTAEAWIEYRTTGHGGGAIGASCIGPAEEFCRRFHTIFVDETPLQVWEPWRTDCASYCTRVQGERFEYCGENPCGSIQSVEASRANWCPGAITPPEVLRSRTLLQPGPHTFRYEVEGVVEGGSWRTSAFFVAWGDP
jgi:hypothetical protein